MLDFSPEKMLFIFFIVLIVLGPDKLPEVSRKIGKAMGQLRKLSGGFREEMNKAMTDMTADPPPEGKSPEGKSGDKTGAEVPSDPSASGQSDETTES